MRKNDRNTAKIAKLKCSKYCAAHVDWTCFTPLEWTKSSSFFVPKIVIFENLLEKSYSFQGLSSGGLRINHREWDQCLKTPQLAASSFGDQLPSIPCWNLYTVRDCYCSLTDTVHYTPGSNSIACSNCIVRLGYKVTRSHPLIWQLAYLEG